MAEPLLDLGDIGLMGEGVGGGGSAEGMHAQAVDLGADAGLQAVLAHNGVSPTKVRKVPQDFGQPPGRKGFSAIPELPSRDQV